MLLRQCVTSQHAPLGKVVLWSMRTTFSTELLRPNDMVQQIFILLRTIHQYTLIPGSRVQTTHDFAPSLSYFAINLANTPKLGLSVRGVNGATPFGDNFGKHQWKRMFIGAAMALTVLFLIACVQ